MKLKLLKLQLFWKNFKNKNQMCYLSAIILIIILSASIALAVAVNQGVKKENRTFTIDYNANTFLMNDKPFRYVSGSFHYFRALPETWKTRLQTMKAGGLNAVDTYVEWAIHNPKEDVYTFDGIADIIRFIELAQDEGLYVILRPGPYICAERDNGGLPYWLFKKYPNIKVRTSDANFTHEVEVWYSKLMPKLQKYFYGKGGPIIMVQVENEYGVFHACDKEYLNWLRAETEMYVQGNAILFTTDIPNERISCGKIEGVFATTDFGAERAHEIDKIWETLRTIQPNGPLVNSEFYPGWLTHWQEENQRRNADMVSSALRKVLESGANVNIYMYFGGTNFGFTAGANNWGHGKYAADITSYDYDAVMDESGNPTDKFYKIRDVIKDFLENNSSSTSSVKNMENTTVQHIQKQEKMILNPINLKAKVNLLSNDGLKIFSTKTITNKHPLSFEELDQFSGLVLYEYDLPDLEIDPSLLTVKNLRDRAQIFIDQQFVGILSRENNIESIPIYSYFGRKLQILVENQGRINFDLANDTKGIFGSITIQQFNGKKYELNTNWNSTSIPLEIPQIEKFIQNIKTFEKIPIHSKGLLLEGPVIFYGQFEINNDTIFDTFIDTTDWGKGVIFVNNFNLGRYWPIVGPQVTLYLPKEILKKGLNEIVMIEYQKASITMQLNFSNIPNLDKKTGGPLEIN